MHSLVTYLSVLTSLTVVVTLTDCSVESGPPGEVVDGQERHRGLHTHTRPQHELQNGRTVTKGHEVTGDAIDVYRAYN